MKKSALLILIIFILAGGAAAQTTAFTYQGKLNDGAATPTGQYDFIFRVFSSNLGGSPVGTMTVEDLLVTAGIFTADLDFGNAPFPANSLRWLEIAVRPGNSTGAYTTLLPRQAIGTAPYAINSISSQFAEQSLNASTLGGFGAGNFVQTNDTRLTDSRNPLPNSPNYVQNTTTQQPSVNFNIGGNGTAGGTLSAQNFNTAFEYKRGGLQFLNAVSSNLTLGLETGLPNFGLANTYVGFRSGTAATSNASNNAFFGANAGRLNSNGNSNSFFGAQSGELNSFGGFNSFFGNNAGAANTLGSGNTFVGVTPGRDNINGDSNTFAGAATGQANQSGGSNSFFGSVAGVSNTTGSSNSFFGNSAGQSNTTGTFNTAFGSSANVGAGNLTFATAIGAGALVTSSNTVVLGRNLDTVRIPGNLNVVGSFTGNFTVPANNITGVLAQSNGGTGLSSPGASGNFLRSNGTNWTNSALQVSDIPGGSANYIQNIPGIGQQTASFNITGGGSADVFNAATQFNINGFRVLGVRGNANIFVGYDTGTANTTGEYNSFIGTLAGYSNTTGVYNSLVGSYAGFVNTTGGYNSFLGGYAGISNTTGDSNSFIGALAGYYNTPGNNNSFVGKQAGISNSTGNRNSFFGFNAGYDNGTGSDNTSIGYNARFTSVNLSNTTALGANAQVSLSNSMVLGDNVSVGIGTSAPVFKLLIVDSSNTGLRVQTNTAGGTVASFGGNGAFLIDAPGTGGGRFTIKENGNVGIGTNNPNTKLQVAGGSVYIAQPNSLIITSPNGACWFITVNNAGALSTISLPCP